MKKIIFGLIATALMSLNTNAQDIEKSTPIDLGLGKVSTWAGGCENAAGACATKSKNPTIDLTQAYAGINITAQGRVAIQMNQKFFVTISSGLVNGGIAVGTEFSFPKNLMETIGIYHEYKVKPGNYKGVYADGVYTFVF